LGRRLGEVRRSSISSSSYGLWLAVLLWLRCVYTLIGDVCFFWEIMICAFSLRLFTLSILSPCIELPVMRLVNSMPAVKPYTSPISPCRSSERHPPQTHHPNDCATQYDTTNSSPVLKHLHRFPTPSSNPGANT
jgi:hypothetical protein